MNELWTLAGDQLALLGPLALALVLGAAIGIERELADKPAGLRTHMLVAGAAALLVSLGEVVVHQVEQVVAAELIRSDPIRILQAVITGVSFLGAGTIIQRRAGHRIEGLTTAASLLFTVGLGICAALSQYVLAVGATLLALVTLNGVGHLERYLERRRTENGDD